MPDPTAQPPRPSRDAMTAGRPGDPAGPGTRSVRVPAVARTAVAWLVGLGLLAWMTRGIDWRRLAAAVRPIPWWGWLVAVLGFAASYGLRALRMHAELSRRRPVRRSQCLEVMLLHNAAVNVVPMRGGEAAYPLLVHRRLGVPVSDAIGSLVWLRTQDALVLAVIAMALWPGIAAPVRLLGAAGLVAAVLGAVVAVQRAAGSEPPAGPRVLRLAHGGIRALAEAPRHGWIGWAFCVASWTVKLAAVGGLLSGLSGLPLVSALGGAVGGELAGVLPVQGPAGFGTYEAGVWAGSAVGVRSALEIAAAALAVHAVSLTTALAGGALAHMLGSGGGLARREEVR
jgi:uncharacterized membrane protein YbhN (UPF0104 family)